MATEKAEDHKNDIHKIIAELSADFCWEKPLDAVSRSYSLQASIDQSHPLDIAAEEVLIRKSLNYLGGRRWGYARQERDKLRVLLESQNRSTAMVDILTVYADLIEGQNKRAESLYKKIISSFDLQKNKDLLPDVYLLSVFCSLVSENVQVFNIPDEYLKQSCWVRSQTSRVIFNAKHLNAKGSVSELGTIADSMIKVPGIKRINAVWLRAIQGNILLYRGEFAWAERVLTYAAERAETLVGWNKSLLEGIQRDYELAQTGVNNLSVK